MREKSRDSSTKIQEAKSRISQEVSKGVVREETETGHLEATTSYTLTLSGDSARSAARLIVRERLREMSSAANEAAASRLLAAVKCRIWV